METKKMSLKLLIDNSASKVLFAEAEKDFVDFLFNLLSLPLGAVIKLLEGRSTVGCIGNVYKSLGNLKEVYMQPNISKDILLNPKPSTSLSNMPMLMTGNESSNITAKFYTCQYNHRYVSNKPGDNCPQCLSTASLGGFASSFGAASSTNPSAASGLFGFGHASSASFSGASVCGAASSMNIELKPVEKSSFSPANANAKSLKGYVQGIVTYMISDDLSVSPMSTISSISLLNMYNVSQLDALEERVVEFGTHEGLELLKASFQSDAVLTAVFLGKKGSGIRSASRK